MLLVSDRKNRSAIGIQTDGVFHAHIIGMGLVKTKTKEAI
jgi:hypothetical protein